MIEYTYSTHQHDENTPEVVRTHFNAVKAKSETEGKMVIESGTL